MDKCLQYGLAYMGKGFVVMILFLNNINIKIQGFVAKLSELDLRTLVDKINFKKICLDNL